LKNGDELIVMRRGEKVRSQQTGFDIELPGAQVARVRVSSFFGHDETNEGAIANVVSGRVPNGDLSAYFVESAR
jgi:hypothetical protein